MIRLVAALLFLTWTACYARCATELLAVAPAAVDACCQHEQAPAAPAGDDAPCGICDTISSGGLLTSQQLLLLTTLFTLVLVALTFCPAVIQRLARLLLSSPPLISDPPGLQPPLWQFLARTACPVRGPTLA